VSGNREEAVERKSLAAKRDGRDGTGSAAGAPLSAQAGLLLSIQQSAGNRAVTGLVQRWQAANAQTERVKESIEARPAREEVRRLSLPGERRSGVSGSAGLDDRFPANRLGRGTLDQRALIPDSILPLQATSGNVFVGRQRAGAARARRSAESLPVLARARTISSGWTKKKRVKFKLDKWSATLAPGLDVDPQADKVTIGSKRFDFDAEVTATGPPAEVGKFELGFVQTQFRGGFEFKYKRMGHHRTIGERVLPPILGKNEKIAGSIGLLPIRDGDPYTGDKKDKLYYEKDEVQPFAAKSPDTQTTHLDDQPGAELAWTEDHKGQTVHLWRTSGFDSFRTWLVIRKNSWSSTDYRRLGYVDWTANHKSKITPDTANPANGQVVGGGSSGGQITAKVKGVGVYLPVTGGDAANEANEKNQTVSNW
jgi:hypothetical protein